jgi:hypothetical protein
LVWRSALHSRIHDRNGGLVSRPFARRAAIAIVAIPGLFIAPVALPLLPPVALVAYLQAFGLSPKATQTERMNLSALPQYFADMFGWREMAAAVAAVYRDLPPDERAHAVFFAPNYGEAAALDVYGPALGGQPVISGHNSYFLWGPGAPRARSSLRSAPRQGRSRPTTMTFAPSVASTTLMRCPTKLAWRSGSCVNRARRSPRSGARSSIIIESERGAADRCGNDRQPSRRRRRSGPRAAH